MMDDVTRMLDTTPLVKKNQVYEDKLTAKQYRILYVSDDRQGYWIQLDSSSNIPKAFLLDDVEAKIRIGLLIRIPDMAANLDDRSLSPKALLHKDRAWGMIHNIVTMEPDIYICSKRAELLKSVKSTSGLSIRTIYTYLGKYWRGGFRPNALAPDYSQCGGTRIATSLENRPGRHKIPGNNGKVLEEQDFKNFQIAVEEFLRQGMGIKATYKRMLVEFYVRPRFEGDLIPITMNADEKPSFNQFYYWYQKNGDIVADVEAQEGEYKFNLNHRPILGRTETYLMGPGDCFQIDATIGDFYLVMESDRSRLVGRPVIVFIKDAWSRMITGMAITLENSSFQVWREALLNAISSKVDYCARFDLGITKEDWPCDILPSSITTDNGEFAVKAVDEIVQVLGITVENCPPYRGDLKGIIERTFKTYQLELKPYIPGYVDSDAGQRGAVDYRKNSCLDLVTFTAIMIKVVIFYNNYHYLEKYMRTSDMRENGIPAIPLKLWNYGIKYRSGAQRIPERDKCLEVLLEKDEADVTSRGIRLNGLYYSCDSAEKERWIERARVDKGWKIPVRYNPFSCTNIYIKGEDGKYISCPLLEASAENATSNIKEVATAHQEDLKKQAEYSQPEDQAYVEIVQFIKNQVDRCSGERESGKVIIKNLSKSSINENRKEEIDILSGMAEARKMQADLRADELEAPGDLTGTKNGPDLNKPRSYEAVSNEIDRLMAKVLRGTGNKEPEGSPKP